VRGSGRRGSGGPAREGRRADAPADVNRPIVLVHGQPGLSNDWDKVVERLGPNRMVFAADRPGYGSAGPATTMAANADLLAEAIRRGGGTAALVVGHSYGGGIALLLADRHPDLVAGLVLVASIGGEGSIGWVDRFLAAPVVGPVVSTAALATTSLLSPWLHRRLMALGNATGRVLARYLPDELLAGLASPSAWRTFAYEQRTLIAETDLVAGAVHRLAIPCVVMVGTRDVVVPPRAGARLAADLAGSSLLLVAGAGHLLLRERPGLVARTIVALEGQLPGADPRGHGGPGGVPEQSR